MLPDRKHAILYLSFIFAPLLLVIGNYFSVPRDRATLPLANPVKKSQLSKQVHFLPTDRASPSSYNKKNDLNSDLYSASSPIFENGEYVQEIVPSYVSKLSQVMNEMSLRNMDAQAIALFLSSMLANNFELSRDDKVQIVEQLLLSSYANNTVITAILNSTGPFQYHELSDSILSILITSSDPQVRLSALDFLRHAYGSYSVETLTLRPNKEAVRRMQEILQRIDFPSLEADSVDYQNYEKSLLQFSPVAAVNQHLNERLHHISADNMSHTESVLSAVKETYLSRPYDQTEILQGIQQEFAYLPEFAQARLTELLHELNTTHNKELSTQTL